MCSLPSMKLIPGPKPAALADAIDTTRDEISAAARSVEDAARLGMVAFALVAVVAVAALCIATARA